MDGFQADLATQVRVTGFCTSPGDQLVLFFAGHGIGAPYNPTGERTLRMSPRLGRNEYIPQRAFCERLARIPEITANPGKVYLILYSCRSGGLFDAGVFHGALKGMHVITATSDGDALSDIGFGVSIGNSLQGSTTWTDFISKLKWWAVHDRRAAPRNGDVAGCRVQVVLASVAYGGADIGNDWSFTVHVERDRTNIAEHVLAPGTAETPNTLVYDRIHGACPTVVPALAIRVDATEVDLNDDVGSAVTSLMNTPCDGVARQHAIVVNVTEGARTASLTFSLSVTATCV